MMAYTGSDAAEDLASASTSKQVDATIMGLVASGAVPKYIKTNFWKWLTIKGGGHNLRILVAPDYAAVGTDEDPYRMARMTPFGAQAVADHYHAILPSTKLLDEIQAAASPRIPYLDVKAAPYNIPLAQIESPKASDAANRAANKAMEDRGITPGDGIVIGYRKAIVIHPNLDGSRVAIYGGRWDASGKIVQPYSTIHDSSYGDYAHGVVLISRKAELDGAPVDLQDDVFLSDDPSVVALVSKDGRFKPRFPSVGSGSGAARASLSEMAADRFGGEGSFLEGLFGGGGDVSTDLGSGDGGDGGTGPGPGESGGSSASSFVSSLLSPSSIVGAGVGATVALITGLPGLFVAGSGVVGSFVGRYVASVATKTGEA